MKAEGKRQKAEGKRMKDEDGRVAGVGAEVTLH